jgi:hypothetical protein
MSELAKILDRLGQEYTKEWDVKVYVEDGDSETIRGLTEGQKITLVWILTHCNVKYRACEVIRRKRRRRKEDAG